MGNKTILYVGNFKFPDKNATSQRILGNSRVFKELNYDVVLIGADNETKNSMNPIETRQEKYGFVSYMLPYPSKVTEWIKYKKQFSALIKLINEIKIKEDIEHIIMYGSPSISLWGRELRSWCRSNNISFLVDCVDWLSASRGNLIFRLGKWIDTTYQKRYLNSSADGVIVVSKYLSNYYSKKNPNVVIMPPLTDTTQEKFNSENSESVGDIIKLIYVGSPFPTDNKKIDPAKFKDRLDKVILYLNKVKKQGVDFKFNIYGLFEKDYLKKLPDHEDILDNCNSSIIFHGNVTHEEAIKHIQNSDFFIFFRDINRMTMSGFPTKFVEAISSGTPVVTNKTSDLYKYLENGVNGFFIDMENEKGIAKELKNVIETPKEQIVKMKDNCKKSKLFDYKNYIVSAGNFLKQIEKSK